MNVQTLSVDPALLRPNPWNSNQVGPENQEKLDESVRRNGMFRPVVVREVAGVPGYEILGGEHRWQSVQRVGQPEIPISNLGFISDEKAKEITLLDNSRYGADDAIGLAAIMKSLGDEVELASYLPYTEADVSSIFASQNIDLDDLDVDLESELPDNPVPETPREARTHTMMRFKVPLGDSEKIADLIKKTQKKHGLIEADDLTNAGDALVQLLLGAEKAE